MWARVRSPGPLMADKAGARGNTIHADEQPARGEEEEGVVRGEGSVEDESSCHWITGVKMDQRTQMVQVNMKQK